VGLPPKTYFWTSIFTQNDSQDPEGAKPWRKFKIMASFTWWFSDILL